MCNVGIGTSETDGPAGNLECGRCNYESLRIGGPAHNKCPDCGWTKTLHKFEDLKWQRLREIVNIDDRVLRFIITNNDVYELYHSQDCCERVRIEDITGDLSDLLYKPILLAEEVENAIPSPDAIWTFYKLSTNRGSVTIRWSGKTDSTYSVAVSWRKVIP